MTDPELVAAEARAEKLIDARIAQLKEDRNVLLWLHAELHWLLDGSCRSYFDGRRKMQARIDKALQLVDDLGECIDYPGDWAGAPLSQRLRAALVDEDDEEQPDTVVPTTREQLVEFFTWLPKRAAVDDQAQPDAELPTTREELAKFFGGIRLAGSGAVVTGIFVQTALDILDANERRIPCRCGAGVTHHCGRVGIEGVD